MSEFFASAGAWAYVGLFALATGESSAFLGFAVPGETFVLLAGGLAARGDLDVGWVIAAAIAGGVIGDSIGYALGRHFGTCGQHGFLGRVWSCARMAKVKRFLDARGRASIFFARFIGFFRALAPFAAGAVRMRYDVFLVYNIAGAVVWGVGTVLAGYFVGEAAETLFRRIGVWGAAGAIVVGVGVYLAVRISRRGIGSRAAEGSEVAGSNL